MKGLTPEELAAIEGRLADGRAESADVAALLHEVRRLQQAVERTEEALRLREAILGVWRRTLPEHEQSAFRPRAAGGGR